MRHAGSLDTQASAHLFWGAAEESLQLLLPLPLVRRVIDELLGLRLSRLGLHLTEAEREESERERESDSEGVSQMERYVCPPPPSTR